MTGVATTAAAVAAMATRLDMTQEKPRGGAVRESVLQFQYQLSCCPPSTKQLQSIIITGAKHIILFVCKNVVLNYSNGKFNCTEIHVLTRGALAVHLWRREGAVPGSY